MSLIISLKRFIAKSAKLLLPIMYWKRKLKILRLASDEEELSLLPVLCNAEKISIDIGASGGLYIVRMIDYSAKSIAFEPRPGAAADLKALIKTTKANASVEAVALSDKSGTNTLRMLEKDLGRSTIEESNILDENKAGKKIAINVPVRTLDEYKFENVALIKIDVEGHEFSVLKGSAKTIEKNLPSLIIEIENRHKENATTDVNTLLKGYGYEGFFILNRKLLSINNFDKAVHQDPVNCGDMTNNYHKKGIYINNFIFVPSSRTENFLQAANALL